MMDPLPPISKVFSYVVQQERKFVNSNMLASMINSANTSSRSNFCYLLPVILNNVAFDTVFYNQMMEPFLFHKVIHTTWNILT